MRFKASAAAAAVGGRLSGPEAAVDGAAFDSRVLTPGQLFVPLVPPVAERDGHEFIASAMQSGAGAYLTSQPPQGGTAIEVDDTLAAYMRLGRWAREQLTDSVVGITGSVGKTSVKDMVHTVLSTRWRTHSNAKSFNNEFGLPTTIVNAPDDTQVLVTEMGMRGFGEIAALCEVALPTTGVVTRVAEAHGARVGGIDGVRRAKGELIEALPSYGVAVLNADDPRVATMAQLTSARSITFGFAGDVRVCDVALDDLARPTFTLSSEWGSVRVCLPVSGVHMAVNAAAAAAVGLVLAVPIDDVAAGLERFELSALRMETARLANGAVVLNDSYNANPTSMRAALDALAAFSGGGRRVAVLGVMAEIDDPVAEHSAIARYANDRGIELIPYAVAHYGGAPAGSPGEVVERLGLLASGDAVLLKGSRVAGLERVAAVVQEVAGGEAA